MQYAEGHWVHDHWERGEKNCKVNSPDLCIPIRNVAFKAKQFSRLIVRLETSNKKDFYHRNVHF
jgi:hypothetical protein